MDIMNKISCLYLNYGYNEPNFLSEFHQFKKLKFVKSNGWFSHLFLFSQASVGGITCTVEGSYQYYVV